MENHKEKLAIFDSYAEVYGFADFESLLLSEIMEDYDLSKIMKDILNATDLVQKEALKRASEGAKTKKESNSGSWFDAKIDKQSILSDENLVK